jgi:hypothetical protein
MTAMTVYLYMHSIDRVTTAAAILRLGALRMLRDELSALPGIRVSAVPQGADLEVEIINVTATDDGPGCLHRDIAQRILVVRMCANGERLDFVCSDGQDDLTAERQAARRIRNWIAGEDFFSTSSAKAMLSTLRATA